MRVHRRDADALDEMQTAFCSDARFVEHDTGAHHPERPDRIRAIYKAVRDAGLVSSPNSFPDFELDMGIQEPGLSPLLELAPAPADEKWILAVHPDHLLQRVKRACSLGGVLDQSDTPTEPRSYATALLAAGAGITCCDVVMNGVVRRAFAAVRPPGHHAEPDRSMGFCLFNNIAIAARYLQQAHGVGKIAIVDFDVHHGNGTQAVFESDPSVLFISLHQDPRTCYPGSGYDWEKGVGPGLGTTINLPLNPGTQDSEYLAVMQSKVLPALDAFLPEMLLISAGFDAHADDPLAQLQLSDEAFGQITHLLVQAANQHCGGKIVSLLEGGYNLRALGCGVVRHLTAMNL